MFTDKQIEAAALAYVGVRYTGDEELSTTGAKQWARDYPEHFADLKQRLRIALEAAHKAAD